jgi:hypothetical protein
MEDDEILAISENELFDISDIEIDVQRTKGLCKLYVVLKSDTPINLMRFYLCMKQYLFQIETEIGIMDGDQLEIQ